MADLMKKLKQPEPADIAKERKLATRPAPPIGVKSSTKAEGTRSNDVRFQTLKQRPNKYPNQGHRVIGTVLWCDHCKDEVGSADAVVRTHIKSDRHQDPATRPKTESTVKHLKVLGSKAALEKTGPSDIKCLDHQNS